MVEAIALAFVGFETDSWLKTNGASAIQVKNWSVFFLSFVAVSLPLCVLGLLFGDRDGVVARFTFMELFGFGFLTLNFIASAVEDFFGQ
jgi:hypothetical protein